MLEDTSELAQQLERLSTDELVSILRNRDEEEWQPNVFDIVASILAARGLEPPQVVGPRSASFALRRHVHRRSGASLVLGAVASPWRSTRGGASSP
jgi:hypothetical protein